MNELSELPSHETSPSPKPRISVVIPTYNRSGFLRATLESLVAQSLPPDEFEVIVSDDGSSDDSADVVKSFTERLRIKYHFQEDLGFRAGAARNAGARMAEAPILAFLDTGARPGAAFLRWHLRAHDEAGPQGRAVIGWMHGYPSMFNDEADSRTMEGLSEALDRLAPEDVVARFHDEPLFRDPRYAELEKLDFDLSRRSFPEELFWTANCSVRAADFRSVGGFDEGYRSWGMEDVDLGFRLARKGLEFHFCPDAWVVESQHERDETGNFNNLIDNAVTFMVKYKFCVTALEMFWLTMSNPQSKLGAAEAANQIVVRWARATRGVDVAEEIEQAFAAIPPGSRVAVFGCGAVIPTAVTVKVLADFDPEVVEKLRAEGHPDVRNNVGIHLALRNRAVDFVIITSRLRGLWDQFGRHIQVEADRIGTRTLQLFPVQDRPDVE